MKKQKLTSIYLVIDTFKKVLRDYKKALKQKKCIEEFICFYAKDKYRVDLSNIFHYKGYYKNYVGSYALYVPFCNRDSVLDIIAWKINFLKVEIKELTKLKKQGYTHI